MIAQVLWSADLKPELNSYLNPPVSEGTQVLPGTLIAEVTVIHLWSVPSEEDHPIVSELQTKEGNML